MPKKLYLISLTHEERNNLFAITSKGKFKARQINRAMILLNANEGLSDPQIMTDLNVGRPCIESIRKRYVSPDLLLRYS